MAGAGYAEASALAIDIVDIEYELPGAVLSNADLAAEHPDWDMGVVGKRVGVRERRIASPEETALDLAERAAVRLLERGSARDAGRQALIFCTESPDYVLPANACVLHGRLGLPTDVPAFDYNLACSGFPYGLAIARGLLGTGMADDILLILSETYSKYIHADDRSCRALFGDGAAVARLSRPGAHPRPLYRVDDISLGTCGELHRLFILPNRACRRESSFAHPEHLNMDGMGIRNFVAANIPPSIRALLAKNNLEVGEVDFWAFHQASEIILQTLVSLLRLPREKVLSNLALLGNTVSASIPILLKQSLDAGGIPRGSTLMTSGFGVGLSWGSALLTAL